MTLMAQSLAFAVAALCAATMGFAIQRGATCTVAAVEEVIDGRGVRRLAALVEASVWVAVGLLVAHRLGWLAQLPQGYALGAWTIVGAVLLGLGAFTARACVFGAIARLGSGDWAYAATPLGFYLGCLSLPALFAPAPARALASGTVLPGAPAALVWAGAGVLVWRTGTALALLWRRGAAWSPHLATIVIGLTFLTMLVLAGAWAYTDVLAELARGMARGIGARLVLLACLLLGAIGGGWSAGRLRFTPPRAAMLARCLVGGALMGWGSLLIPGGNDGLVLVGMPMFWPYAWAAFATMCVSIGAAQVFGRRLERRSPRHATRRVRALPPQ